MSVDAMSVLAAGLTATATVLMLQVVAPPPRRLRDRLAPFLRPTPATVGRRATGILDSVFGPVVRDVADWIGALVDRDGAVNVARIRQAGWFGGLEGSEMIHAYRLRQLKAMASGVAIALLGGLTIGASWPVRLVLVGLGLVAGVGRVRGSLERSIEDRRETMKIEVYTVNQLLAMRVRSGAGVIQAVSATVDRGSGEVVAELAEALRLHRSGWRASDAFRRIAELTPEPFCSRTYRLLASADERGADLASALLALSEDVRETRRESIKRAATKRRAAMLVPTVAVLAPVLILFVAAPLPYLITGWQ